MMSGIPIVSAADLWARDQEERRNPLIRREPRMEGRRVSFQEELMRAAGRVDEEKTRGRVLELR